MGILRTTTETGDHPPVSAEWITPEGAGTNKVLLYFHGGGFEAGNAGAYRAAAGNFIDMAGYRTLLMHCSPASGIPVSPVIKESAGIYLWLLERGYRPEDIVFAGDSAGGGIEICTLIKLRDDSIPMPAACVAFSPDLNMISSQLAAPPGLSGDLAGLPPIMIHVGKDDVKQRDDAARFGAAADSYGVDVRVKIWKGIPRGCPLLVSGSEDSMKAMEQAEAFIRQNLQKESGIAAALLYMAMFSVL